MNLTPPCNADYKYRVFSSTSFTNRIFLKSETKIGSFVLMEVFVFANCLHSDEIFVWKTSREIESVSVELTRAKRRPL